jgi:hypothetical protein
MARSRLMSAASIVFLTALASGCATLTSGSKQAISLNTDPDGATCDLVREARPLASLATTPGQVQVDRERAAIDIACRKSGYQLADLHVESMVDDWTFGNILIGGVIGFAVDAATGAMRQYPQYITLTLVPEEFATAEERDRYVKERLARFDNEAATAAELLGKRCGVDACPSDHKALQAAKEQRVVLFQAHVGKARIRAPATAMLPAAAPVPAKPASN